MNDITFYQRFEADILAGRKTITIRDKSESHFKAGDILRVGRFEDNQYFCTIEVLSVSPITLDELTEQHAAQENMGLEELKEVIRGIYPNQRQYYIVLFKVIPPEKFYIIGQGKYSSKEFYERLNLLPRYHHNFELVFLSYTEDLYERFGDELDYINTVIITDEQIKNEQEFIHVIQENDFLTQERAIFALELTIAFLVSAEIFNQWRYEDLSEFISDFKSSNINSLECSSWVDSMDDLYSCSKMNISNICISISRKFNEINKIYSFLFFDNFNFHDNIYSSIMSTYDLNENFIKEKTPNSNLEQRVVPFFSIWKHDYTLGFSERFKIATVII